MAEDRYVFIVEWFDSAAALVRNYNLTYFLKDRTIDMVHPLPHSSISRISASSSNVVSTQQYSSKISSLGLS
jgi:hypothetical protein